MADDAIELSSSPRRAPRRRWTLVALATVAGAGGLGVALSLGAKPGPVSAATPTRSASLAVEIVQPQRTTLARSLAASGSVAARDELLIGSDAQGVRLTEVLVEVGANVQRGQLLARGDDSTLRAQLAQQEALIRQAEAEHAQALSNLERAERVKDSGVYSVEATQTRRTAADAAAAKLDLARAQRSELLVHLAQTRVLAPADGIVARRSATVGAVMQPGQELFRLIRDGRLEWLAELPAAALAQVRPGARARLQLDDGRSIDGQVRLIQPTLDARTRNGLVHVTLPMGTTLKAGAHVSGEIVVGDASVLTLPASVLFVRDGDTQVFVLDDADVAHRRRVGTGARQDGLVEVQGLAPDARVVATGAGFVKDGERVRVAGSVPAAATPGAQP